MHPSCCWYMDSLAYARRRSRKLFLFVSAFHPIPSLYNCVSHQRTWDSLGSPDLFEATDRFKWSASSCASPVTNPDSWPHPAEGPSPPLPYAKCIMNCSVDGNDELLRGEICAIIMIMRGRLRTKAHRSHLITPVSDLSPIASDTSWQKLILTIIFWRSCFCLLWNHIIYVSWKRTSPAIGLSYAIPRYTTWGSKTQQW